VNQALAVGAGQAGLFHQGTNEVIAFSPAVERVGFLFGSNQGIDVPVTVLPDGAVFHLVVPINQLLFFGFEDSAGITSLTFGEEQIEPGTVSNLDNLRFESAPEAPGGSLAVAAALVALARRRRN
jgi:MYXO-CTERM domain-containing protein